jgi:glycerol-3-phosphate O-acyltransferase
VQLVPVSIFVGRAPTRQSGWFSVLFSEHWVLVGRFRRLLAILLNGRDTLVQFSPSVPVREIIAEELPHERTVRKTSRVLRAHFHKLRAAVIGPDLSTRRLLVDRVLDAEPVRKAITDQARRDGSEYLEAWKKAHAFAWEIAADYSNPVVRSLSFMLTYFWNRIYDGVSIHHLEQLKAVAPGNEIVYVPCHRSHMDYLLLSYLLYQHGVVPPHIAAGDNLNLPVIGSILRRGGAFFLRRSIRGNALYAAVFLRVRGAAGRRGFLARVLHRGRALAHRPPARAQGRHAGDDRARLPARAAPAGGVRAGVHRLREADRGQELPRRADRPAKKKESIWALLRGVGEILRSHYGKVTVNFGEPVRMDEVLVATDPDWRAQIAEDKPSWLGDVVDTLAHSIQVNINRAADVNPVNLLAVALLATPKHAMGEGDLLAQLALSKKLLAALPYSGRVTVTPMTPAEMIAYGEQMQVLTRRKHPARRRDQHRGRAGGAAELLPQQRAAPVQRRGLDRAVLPDQPPPVARRRGAPGPHHLPVHAQRAVPALERGRVRRAPAADHRRVHRRRPAARGQRRGRRHPLARPGQTDEVFRLRAIAHSLQQAFERYFIAVTTLVKNGPLTLSAGELESMCHLAAQRLSLLYAPAAPEFFDKSLFRGFIQTLRDLKMVWPGENGKLDFDERLNAWEKDAKLVLSRELRATISKISPEAVKKAPPNLKSEGTGVLRGLSGQRVSDPRAPAAMHREFASLSCLERSEMLRGRRAGFTK